ncbi:MAG: phosphotransferase [Bacteroidetes bacterium]|nr:phosphotransferase [Bacteroidota bacterium]
MNSIHSHLTALFKSWSGAEPTTINALPGSGSSRRYFRMAGHGHTAMGVHNPIKKENLAFLAFTRHFLKHGLNVPEIYAEDLVHDVYLISDLGNRTLFSLLESGNGHKSFTPEIIDYYKLVLRELISFQIIAGSDMDYSFCYPKKSFDKQAMLWDLNYFKYYFLRFADTNYDEQNLECDFSTLADFLLKADSRFFQYRDFQSRNILIFNDKPYFIDYQGGRRGALQYDMASLLFQAKAEMPVDVREELLHFYMDELQKHIHYDMADFEDLFNGYVLIRLLQVLGAYGLRGLIEHKPHFLQSIPYAIANIDWFIRQKKLAVSLPELMSALERLVENKTYRMLPAADNTLTVRINSFAYKNGIPADYTGNGGGFVFDCRALPNPGKFDEYRFVAGTEMPVILFMQEKEEVKKFLDHVYVLVDQAVEDYQAKGFMNLQVNFGCTGGQHRSVYCAEQLWNHLTTEYKMNFSLTHTEQANWILTNPMLQHGAPPQNENRPQ